jgi:NAD(P)-dependent dehydrogenase (short-subunit alcohol dehydrogenase family)
MKKLPERSRAVVTGAGSGLGRAVALELADRGARVLCTDVNEASAAETVELLARRGASGHAMKVDVRKADEVGAMEEKARSLYGGTDVLVNNAGLAVVGELGKIPVEDWQYQVDVNLMGVIWGCHHFAPKMREQGGGFILNVASAAGIASAPLMGPYNVTKAGVIALSETLFVELSPHKIHVSALCPTFLRTNIHKDTRAHGMGTDKRTDKLVTEAKWSAEEIAKIAVRDMLRGRLYIIPQTDGKVLWRLKRALGQGFYSGLRQAMRKNLVDRMAPEKKD